jgi:hypothetical protein
MIKEAQVKYIKSITNSWLAFFYMFQRLPSIAFWGVKVKNLSDKESLITIKHRWTNQNPFGSIYFSALSGAAELSTGVIVQLHLQGRPTFSMLVVHSESFFYKKAKGLIKFECNEGDKVFTLIESLSSSGDSGEIVLNSKAIDENNIEVGNFKFKWSIKRK